MFRSNLEKRFKNIFGFEKVSFLAPNLEAPEQDCLFVAITEVRPRMSNFNGGAETAIVTGDLIVFSQDNRLTYGFFAKRIEQAEIKYTSDIIFGNEVDIENSPARLQNIHEKRVPFTFLYNSQYDPDRGALNTIELELSLS